MLVCFLAADCCCCAWGPSCVGQPEEDPAVQPARQLCPGRIHLWVL